MLYLKTPIVIRTVSQCRDFMKVFPSINLSRFISREYNLPAIIYSDSANYTDDENYLTAELENMSSSRRRETSSSREWMNVSYEYIQTDVPKIDKCVWSQYDTGKGYINYMSGCCIESGSLPAGWNYCPYCGKPLERREAQYAKDK